MEVLQLLPAVEKIAVRLSRRHHHDVDDLKGQGTVMLVQMCKDCLDVPKIISNIKFGLMQWMSKDKLIPRNYKTAKREPNHFEPITEDSLQVESQSISELIEELRRLPENESERTYLEMKLDGCDDDDVCCVTQLALGTINNIKSRLKKRYYDTQ